MDYSPMVKNNARSDLARTLEEFMKYPFPPTGRGNKELEDAHGSLILYDAAVGGVVTSILNHATSSEERLRELRDLQENPGLEEMFDKLVEKYPDTDNVGKVARQYVAYYYQIKKLLNATNSYVRSIGY